MRSASQVAGGDLKDSMGRAQTPTPDPSVYAAFRGAVNVPVLPNRTNLCKCMIHIGLFGAICYRLRKLLYT